MTFPWQNNGTPPAPAAGGQAAAPAPAFGGPAAAFGGPPVSAEQALAGFGAGNIDMRDPFLPVGFAGEVELIETEGKTSMDVGPALYIRCKVKQIMAAGGGEANAAAMAGLKNPNRSPAVLEGVYTARISGFGKPKAGGFAISDLKLFLIAVLSYTGLTPQTPVSPEEWDKMGKAAWNSQFGQAGKRFCLQVGATAGAQAKLKYSFYPPVTQPAA